MDLVAGPAPDLLIIQGDFVVPLKVEYFTYSVAVGDFDGDGVQDLAVSGASPGPGADSGAVYVFYGGPFTSPLVIDLGDPAASADLTIFAEGEAAPGFGYALAAGNIDGDGDDELFIGAPYATTADGFFPPGGVVVVLLGPLATSGSRDVTSPGGAPDLEFQAVGSASDGLGAALATGDIGTPARRGCHSASAGRQLACCGDRAALRAAADCRTRDGEASADRDTAMTAGDGGMRRGSALTLGAARWPRGLSHEA
ncbi:MAG: FG-GAP repeat protein [Myxococcota bacterium]|nr:FG-GAP repeat protein [Myxococcota bacterium]